MIAIHLIDPIFRSTEIIKFNWLKIKFGKP
jgi:hypothetical protein